MINLTFRTPTVMVTQFEEKRENTLNENMTNKNCLNKYNMVYLIILKK